MNVQVRIYGKGTKMEILSTIDNDIESIIYECKCKKSTVTKEEFPDLIPTWPWLPVLTMKCLQCEDIVSVTVKKTGDQ